MTDYAVGDTLYHKFSTRAFATGIPTTLSGTPVVSIYEDDSVTEITAGITLTADFDSKQGLNHLTVVATGGNGYEAGKYYQAVITTGTVGGVSIVGETIWTFSLDASGAVAGISALNDPTAAAIADAVHEESLEDHVTEGTTGYAQMLAVYAGPHGPGIYIDSDAANTNTVKGTDGTESNPVSTFVAARTLADGIGTDTYYLETGTDLTLAATHANWRFFGLGSPTDTEIDLGSQDVSLAKFDHINIKGDQGGAGRLFAEDCVLSDPGAGTTTLNILGLRCGIEDDITLDTSNDNVLIDSYSLVAGGAAPIVRASGASGTLIMNGHKGGVDLRDLSASHNLTVNIAGGQVIFDASCNVNANVELRGIGTKTDNTAGMADLNEVAFINMDKINTEVDIAISDAALATAANLAIAQDDLDILTGADGAVIASAQGPVTFTGVSDEAGITVVGQGTGAGLKATAGATGHGFETVGGATSGDGIHANADGAGNGMDLTAVGSNAGLRLAGGAGGPGIHAHGGTDAGVPGVEFHAHSADGDAFELEVDGTGDTNADLAAIREDTGTSIPVTIADLPTVAEFEARTPTPAQLAYIVANAATGVPVTFTTAGGSTTAAVLNLVDGAGSSSTDDQYNGRLLVFSNGTLKDVVTDITDYDGTTKVATITAIPFAPTATHTARLI